MYKITDTTTRNKVYAALASRTREFHQRISFGHWKSESSGRSFVTATNSSGTEMIYNRGIIKLNISQQGNSDGSGLVMGCCCSSSCSAEFYNLDKSFNYAGRVMFVECGIKLDNESFYYIPAGYYIVEEPESDDDWRTVSFTAYDDICRMNNKWSSSLSYPTNAKALLDELCRKYSIAVKCNSDISTALQNRIITETEASVLTAYTEREVCGFIAGLVGANARINTSGEMSIDWYAEQPSDYAVSIPAVLQWQNGFKKSSETAFVINSITSGIDDAVFTAGTGTGISFANPIITEAEITAIYQKYGGMSFQPCICEWRGNPCIECGDIISATDRNGAEYSVFVAEQDIDLTGGLSMVITCPSGDAEISFDTVDERTRKALNKQKTDLQAAIEAATAALNGAKGGFYEILDSDDDGNPDGWIIKETADGLSGIIRANKAGIGLSTDGGKTYRTAITYKGINADCIYAGKVKAEFVETDGLIVGTGNVTGLDEKLSELDDYIFDLEYGTSAIGETQQEIIDICLTEDMTQINGAHLATGSVLAASIAANAITADKLSVGVADRGNLFYNHNFSETYKDENSVSKAVGWGEAGGTLAPQGGWAIFSPSSSGQSGYYQNIFMKKSRYALIARMNFHNLSSISSSAALGYRIGGSLYTPSEFSVSSSAVSDLGGEMIVKIVFDYEGEEKINQIGFWQEGFSFNNGYISLTWAACFEANDEKMLGFFCSNKAWIKSGYEDERYLNVRAWSAAYEDFKMTTSPFSVDYNGNLDVISGRLGCVEFSRESLELNSNIYNAYDDTVANTSMVINVPSGTHYITDDGSVASSLYEATHNIMPSILITNTDFDALSCYSYMSLTGFECKLGNYRSYVNPTRISTNGTLKCSECDCTSREKYKNKISEKSSVLDKFKSSKIYEYNLNIEKEKAKRKTGFIVERETPEEIISDDGDGINLYSMASMNWKATQEIIERLENLERAVKQNA